MKYVVLLMMVMLFQGPSARAQDMDDLRLENLNNWKPFAIKFPLSIVYSGETVEVELISEYFRAPTNYRIAWEVIGGMILEGQETRKIRVETNESAKKLIVRAEVLNFSVDVTRAFGELELISRPKPILVNETTQFLSLSSQRQEAIVKAFIQRVSTDLSNKPYIYIYPKNDASHRKIRERLSRSFHNANLDISRLTFGRKSKGNDVVQFYLMPENAKLPF